MFYKLPQDLTARKDLKASDKIVFTVIADHIGQNGYGWPGIRTLARKTGLSKSTIVESLRRLETAEEMDIQRRDKGKSTHYRLPKSVPEISTVGKLKCTENRYSGVPEISTQVYRKSVQNQIDLLNQTKEAPFVDFLSLWKNKGNLPNASSTLQRKKAFCARMKETLFADNWRTIIEKLSASDFCTGKNGRGWKADIDWILKNETNYAKVLEGKYDNKTTGGNKDGDGYEAYTAENLGITHEATEEEAERLIRLLEEKGL